MIENISSNIDKYIQNSKLNGKFIKWNKSAVNIFIVPIVANISNKNFYYSEIQRAISIWNNCLRSCQINLQYYVAQSVEQADVVIHWVKVGRVYEGMCKYTSLINNEIKKISIDIGLPNEHSGKNTTDESIFFAIMHELGHALGLGHGVVIDDLMYVPHKKNISKPSANDLYVLELIYKSVN